MSDLICRKTMQRCPTPGMCSPHGGCQPDPATETVDSTWLAQLRREFVTMGDELGRVRAERDQLKAANGTLSAINEQRRNHLGNAKKAAGIEADDDLVGAISALVEDRRQRDLLAQAIADAAHKAGIIHADAQCDGPTLLMVLNDLVGCVERAEAEAAMHRNLEYAAEHLPEGWLIQVTVEFEGGGVELINPDGEDVAFPSNGESRAQEVRDAVDALINPEPEYEADDLPPPPAGLVAPVPGPDERICWQEDCVCCGGTGREPDGSRCLGEIPF